MRISDWSSDVCSSDLAMDSLIAWLVPMVKRYLVLGMFANNDSNTVHKTNITAVNTHRSTIGGDSFLDIDRERVVKGESVCVREDSGSRGIITKKQNT